MTNFDYIIIGAGSAGCVLADRLSEDGDKRILVLEAGGPDRNWLIKVPLGVGKIWNGPHFNWSYQSEPEPHADNRSIYHPRGKVVGGSSSINMMAYVRGNRMDYDRWRQMGLEGWSYADVLPYFKRAETFDSGNSPFHGDRGPLNVRSNVSADPTFSAFRDAGDELGYGVNDDYNAETQDGVAYMQYTIRNGRRCSAAVAYLRPALRRGSVEMETGVHVTRIILEEGRAVGVAYLKGGTEHEVRTGGEVLLSAGAINSPQLLMLSGIGPAEHLRQTGVTPVVDLKGVGQNLQDHTAVSLTCRHRTPSGFRRRLRFDRLATSMIQAYLLGTGFATQPPGGMTAFVRSRPELEIPDIQLFCRNGGRNVREWFPLVRKPGEDGFMMRACHLRPESRGAITLGDGNPLTPARIRNNFLSTETDRATLREGVRIMRRIAHSTAFSALNGGELMPGPDVVSDDEIDAYVRSNLDTVYHPCGTCRIGSDPDSVVDPEFRVRGVDGLRVIDASVMPDLVGGNINAPVIMIAEKASDIIRGKQPLPAAEIPNAGSESEQATPR